MILLRFFLVFSARITVIVVIEIVLHLILMPYHLPNNLCIYITHSHIVTHIHVYNRFKNYQHKSTIRFSANHSHIFYHFYIHLDMFHYFLHLWNSLIHVVNDLQTILYNNFHYSKNIILVRSVYFFCIIQHRSRRCYIFMCLNRAFRNF